jgi:hypothetical protein
VTRTPTRALLTAAVAAALIASPGVASTAPRSPLTLADFATPTGPALTDDNACPDSGDVTCPDPLFGLFGHSSTNSTSGGSGAINASGFTSSHTTGGDPPPNLLQQYVLDPLRAMFNGGNYSSADTTSTATNDTSASTGGNHVAVANTGGTATNTDVGTNNVQNTYSSGPGSAENLIEHVNATANNQTAVAYGGSTGTPSDASNVITSGSNNTQNATSRTGGLARNTVTGSNNIESATASNNGDALTLVSGVENTGAGNGNHVTSSADNAAANSIAFVDNNRVSTKSTSGSIATGGAEGVNNTVITLASGANSASAAGAGAGAHTHGGGTELDFDGITASGNYVSSTATGGGAAAAEALSNNNHVTAQGLNGGVADANAGATPDGRTPTAGDLGRNTVTATATGTGSAAAATANNASNAEASANTGGQASSVANLGSTAQSTATGDGTATATATETNSVAIAKAFGSGASATASATGSDPAGGTDTVSCTTPGSYAFAYTSEDGKTNMQFC